MAAGRRVLPPQAPAGRGEAASGPGCALAPGSRGSRALPVRAQEAEGRSWPCCPGLARGSSPLAGSWRARQGAEDAGTVCGSPEKWSFSYASRLPCLLPTPPPPLTPLLLPLGSCLFSPALLLFAELPTGASLADAISRLSSLPCLLVNEDIKHGGCYLRPPRLLTSFYSSFPGGQFPHRRPPQLSVGPRWPPFWEGEEKRRAAISRRPPRRAGLVPPRARDVPVASTPTPLLRCSLGLWGWCLLRAGRTALYGWRSILGNEIFTGQ